MIDEMLQVLQMALSAVLLAAPLGAGEPARTLDVTAGEERQYFGEPIDLSLRDADLVETLRSFAEIGSFNLMIDPAVQGTVTVELKGVPWDQALEQILKIHGLGMEVSGGVVDVATRRAQAERRRLHAPAVASLALRYADAGVVAAAIGRPGAGILTADGRAWTEPGNVLVVKDTRVRLLHLGRLVARIDVEPAADDKPADLERRCLAAWRQLTGG